MTLSINGFSVNFILGKHKSDSVPVLFLHGFTGSSKDWQDIMNKLPDNYYSVAIDLPGHGHSSHPAEIDYYTAAWIIKIINEVMNYLKIPKFVLCGYSMGGRAALNYAINFSSKVSMLILESSTAGIENEVARNARINSDENLCSMIETKGIDFFVDYWMNLELFSDLKNLPSHKYDEIVQQKKNNISIGLTNSLRGFGTGSMASLWNSLPKLEIPTLLITGSADKKFTQINSRMNKLIKNSEHKVLEDCGHNVHAKKTQEFLDLLINFIS